MADNAQKRALVNRALLILQAGRTSSARLFFTEITDDEFSDPLTNITTQKDKLAACVSYEPILLMVLSDIKPDFAKKYADLGAPIRINKEFAEWSYLFEMPSDYDSRLKDAVRQVDQDNHKKTYDFDVLHFESFAHVVSGTDDQAYYCSTAHTSAAATKPITGASYATYWTLYDTDDIGADWVSGWAYKASETCDLLATSEYSNNPSATVDDDIDSAYIEYIPYTQAGINDKPEYYNEHFKNAFCIRLAAELAIDTKDYERRRLLLQEYEMMAKPDFWSAQQSRKYIEEHTTILEARTK